LSGPHLTTLHAFVRELEALDIKFSIEERTVLLDCAAENILRHYGMKARPDLLTMPCSDKIQ